jgi:hypothetical protein
VIVYHLTRFAREKYDHFALRAHLKSLSISLRSATEPIDDTSTGKLMEGVLAAFAQFDNDVRSDRTRAGMRAALGLGRRTAATHHFSTTWRRLKVLNSLVSRVGIVPERRGRRPKPECLTTTRINDSSVSERN